MKTALSAKDQQILAAKINHILKKLRLTSSVAVEKVIMDQTKSSFSALVQKNGHNYFLKIRLLPNENEKKRFNNVILLFKYLKDKQTSLNKYTPNLLDAGEEAGLDYLLFDYYPGTSLGSRLFHDVIYFQMDDIPKLIDILRSIAQIPVTIFGPSLLKADFLFFRHLIFADSPFVEKKLALFFTVFEIDKIKSFLENKSLKSLLEQSTDTFAHGDFQPPNFIKTTDGKLLLVDFDNCLAANRFYDLLYFYNHAFRKPLLQKMLLKYYFKKGKKLTEEEEYLFRFTSFAASFVWVKVFLNKKDWYRKMKVRDFSWRERIFQKRLAISKALLKQL